MAKVGYINQGRMVWLLVGIILGSLLGATYLYHTNPKAYTSAEVHYYGYVFNGLSSDVSVTDRFTMNVILSKSLSVNPGHVRALIGSKLDYVYLVEDGGPNIYVLDPSTFELKATIPVGKDLQHGATFTVDGRYLLAVSRGENSVVFVDTIRNIPEAQIKVEEKPHDVAASPDGSRVYVTNSGAKSISVIDLLTRKVTETIKLDAEPHMIVTSPDGDLVYVGTGNPYGILVLDLSSKAVVRSIPLKGDPHGLAVTQNGKLLLVAVASEDSVAAIDLDGLRLLREIQVGDHPHSVDFTPDGLYAYVSNSGDGTVSILNIRDLKVVSTIKVGSGPHNVLFYAPAGAVGMDSQKSSPGVKKPIEGRNYTCGG